MQARLFEICAAAGFSPCRTTRAAGRRDSAAVERDHAEAPGKRRKTVGPEA